MTNSTASSGNRVEKNTTFSPEQEKVLKLLSDLQATTQNLVETVDKFEASLDNGYVDDTREILEQKQNVETMAKFIKNLKYTSEEIKAPLIGKRLVTMKASIQGKTKVNHENIQRVSLQQVQDSDLESVSNVSISFDRQYGSATRSKLLSRKDQDSLQLCATSIKEEERSPDQIPGWFKTWKYGNHDACHYYKSPIQSEPGIDKDLANASLNFSVQSVEDITKEYYQGLAGQKPLMYIDQKYGSIWRKDPTTAKYYKKRMSIINKIEDLRKNPTKYGLPNSLTRVEAIKILCILQVNSHGFEGLLRNLERGFSRGDYLFAYNLRNT